MAYYGRVEAYFDRLTRVIYCEGKAVNGFCLARAFDIMMKIPRTLHMYGTNSASNGVRQLLVGDFVARASCSSKIMKRASIF